MGEPGLVPLEAGDVAEVTAHMRETRWAGGMLVQRRGDPPTHVHVVRHGMLGLSLIVGGRRAGVQLVRAGEVVGDVPLLTRSRQPFDVRAMRDSVLLSIESPLFLQVLGRRPRLALRWTTSVADRMAATQSRMLDFLAGDLEAQVASLLLRETSGTSLPMSQATMAELLGANRTSVNRVLKKLEADRLISVGYRHIHLLDREALGELSGVHRSAG